MTQIINLNKSTAYYFAEPYPHLVVDDAFGLSDELEKDFPKQIGFPKRSIRMDSDMSFPDIEYLRLLCQSESYLALHNYVYSPSFTAQLLGALEEPIRALHQRGDLLFDPFSLPIIASPLEKEIFNQNEEVSASPFLFPRLDIGYGGVGYGAVNGGGGIHTDNWNRLISIIYYVNSNKTMQGGEHRMYRIEEGLPILAKEYKPKKGQLIAALQTNTSLHDVNPIRHIEGYRNAYYLAVSCSKKIWREDSEWVMRLTKNRAPKIIIQDVNTGQGVRLTDLGRRILGKIYHKLH